jgi:hypothetical protein
MSSWFELYKKELRSISFFLLVSVLIILGWQFFLLYKIDNWPLGLSFGLSYLPFGFFPLIMLWQGYQSYRQEWKDDTIYFLLSLPRPGWVVSLAKLMAGLTYQFVTVALNLIMVYIISRQTFWSLRPSYVTEEWILSIALKLFIVYIVIGLSLYILSQFSYLISRFYDRFKGLISIVVFVLSSYVIYRGSAIIAPVFKWLPDFPVRIIQEGMKSFEPTTIYVGSGPIVASFILLILLFALGGKLLDSHLEV